MAGRIRSAFSNAGSATIAPFRRGQGESDPDRRLSQVYAAILLPFFMVFSVVAARAIHEMALDLIPTGETALDALRFLMGFLVVAFTGVSWVLWVRSGGFGIFAQ